MLRRILPLKKLRSARKRITALQSGFDRLTDHVIITDSDAHILYANAAALKATGYSLQQMLGKNPGDLWGGHMPKNFYRDLWRRIKKDKKPFVGEMKNVSKNGEERIQELRISPVLDEKGDVAFFVGVEPDISSRVKDKEFREEILSMVGNDSLAPATAVKWALEGLMRKENLTDAQKKTVSEAAAQNDRLITEIRDMIALSSAKGHPLRTKVDLVKMLTRIIAQLKDDHPKMMMSFDPQTKTAVVYSHEKLLEKMLSTPIAYAASAAERSGGKVEVQLQQENGGFVVRCRCSGTISKRDAELRHAFVVMIASYLHYELPEMMFRDGAEECSVRIPKKA